ncbi:MAG: alpha/beta fold hydrolase [Actinobacteria bacterium]|nr:alpha/beta fold hydrolase [Actinomycetota bacterium]MBU1492967.1 alpha/beta fold hydrolase [Actinomycetota bacterium]
MTAEAVRTPDGRFEGLLPYPPRYLEWEGLRLHYLDEGTGPPVVLFHGEPTWAYLYRKVAAVLIPAGYRVIVPDLPGFGRSDKPTDPAFYSYDHHVAAMTAVVEHLDLDGATAVVQDWGGPIGLRLAVEHPDWFSRLSILNTGLFTGREKMSDGFLAWRAFAEKVDDLPVGSIMSRSMIRPWADEVVAAYEAPFPGPEYKVGAHRFPLIVPMTPDDPGAAAMTAVLARLGSWNRPAQVLFSTADPIFTTWVGARLAAHIPGAGDLETIDNAGHFLQEDAGEEVGAAIAAFLTSTD